MEPCRAALERSTLQASGLTVARAVAGVHPLPGPDSLLLSRGRVRAFGSSGRLSPEEYKPYDCKRNDDGGCADDQEIEDGRSALRLAGFGRGFGDASLIFLHVTSCGS